MPDNSNIGLSEAVHKQAMFWAGEALRLYAQELAWRECAEYCRRIKLELRAKRMKGGAQLKE